MRLVDSPSTDSPPEVTYSLVNGDRVSLRAAVETLNTFDVALMQHEYGIFGGLDGAEVLDLLKSLEVPSIVTLHTVLSRPSPSQKSILEAIVGLASQTVVMSETAGQRLIDLYEVDPSKITIIPHGARIALGGPSLADGDRPVFLTWGLIGPGKGLETAIEAFGSLKDIQPLPRYVILGTTHPKVQAASGDTYLNGLVARVQELGLEDIVEFDGRYLDIDELTLAVRRADVVVLPYESTEQVTSGVLVEAIGAGKPIIATAFPHAVELLSGGAGIVVPHSDAAALSAAARSMLENPTATTRMAGRARLMGSTLYWPVVARSYDAMATTLASELQRPGLRDSLARVG
ncbi:MAG TPA: glycosyltransferase [Acidimicrobiia bacterium]|nr:glycosyltransferase [Acidimicrobiia bacterium]